METKKGAGSSSSLRMSDLATMRPLDLVISVDTTLSMHGVLQEMRGAIDDILQRLFRDTVDLRVAIIAHGDYYDGDDAYVTKCVDFTKDGIKLSHFMHTVEGTSGGDWAECYELVLHLAREELSWRPDSKRIVVMLGDAIPHEASYPHNLQHIDWREEIKHLHDDKKVTVSAIQAYSDTDADFFWRYITSQSDGRLLRLGCFEELVGPMVLALVYNNYNTNLFTAFEDEMLACEPDNRKCRLVRHMFDTLRYDNRHQGDNAFFVPKLTDNDDVKKYVSQVITNAVSKRDSMEPPLEVVLCIDTSASMVGVTNALRHDIGGLTDRVFNEIKGVRVAVVVHGDYDSTKYSTMYMDFTHNSKAVKEFVRGLQNISDEQWDKSCKCYELALRQIRLQLSWTPHSRRIIIMVGDSRPHAPNYPLNTDNIDWRDELVVLHQDMEVTIYSIQLHDDQEADYFWYDLAKSTNGKHLHIGKYEKIVSTIIMAIIYMEENVASFRAYENEILAYRGTGRRQDILRHTFNVIYNGDNNSLTSDPAALHRPHPPKSVRIAKPDLTPRIVSDDRMMEIVISIDCTMSMADTLEQLQFAIYDIVIRLFRDIESLRLAIFAHGDYESDAFSTTFIDFTTEVSELTDFVKALDPMTGGHEQECYELVLRDVQDKLAWSPGSQRTLIMMGDASPHEPCHQLNIDAIDWRREIDNLMYQHIRAYSLQLASGKKHADAFWEGLAEGTNGSRLVLEHSDAMVGLAILATVYKERGLESFKAFEKEVMSDHSELKDPRKVSDMFDTLRAGLAEPADKQAEALTDASGPTDADMMHVSSIHSIPDDDDDDTTRSLRHSGSAEPPETVIPSSPAEHSPEQMDRGTTVPTKMSSSNFAPVAVDSERFDQTPMDAGDHESMETDVMIQCAPTQGKPTKVIHSKTTQSDVTGELTSHVVKGNKTWPSDKADSPEDSKPPVKGDIKKGTANSDSGPLDIVFSFDTTLSMIGVIERMRRDIEFITTRLFDDVPNLRLAVFAHGDYDSPNYVIKCLDFTSKPNDVIRFVQAMEDTTGSHWQECYELVLQHARENLSWRPDSRRIIIMVGDSSPHEPHYPLNTDHIDYRVEVAQLARDMKVRIYGLQVYNDSESAHFWKYIADNSGGKYLDVGFTEPLVSVMLLAIVYGEFDKNILQIYAAEVASAGWAARRNSFVRRLFEVLGSKSTQPPAPQAPAGQRDTKKKMPHKQKKVPATTESPSVPAPPVDIGIDHDKAEPTRVKDVTPSKRAQKRRTSPDKIKEGGGQSTLPPPEKKPRIRSMSPISRIPREGATMSESLLDTLYWTEWLVLMQAARPADMALGWIKRQNGPGFRNIRVLSDMNMPAIYEFSVEPPGETVKYPVYLTGTVGFQNIRLDTYFLRQEHLSRQIGRVLKRGCTLYVRRAKIQKPSKDNSAQKTKAQLMKLYDYAWSTFSRHGLHRSIELPSKIIISDNNIGTNSRR